jgi:hypothetical protein
VALRAVQHNFTGLTTPYTAYDSTKTTLGKFIQQYSGTASIDNYAGPKKLLPGFPAEVSPVPVAYPHVIDVGNNTHWLFCLDNSTSSATRRVVLYTFNTLTEALTYKGFVVLTYPITGTHGARGLKAVRYTYSTGTVQAAAGTITGSGTAWATYPIAGGRIGFGSTNPTSITAWYPISTVASDTSITIGATSLSLPAGTSYVIEDLWIYTATLNGTATSGGLFVTKGLSIDEFSPGGVTVPAATTVANTKAVYWLKDAATVTNTGAIGLEVGASYTSTSHDLYVVDRQSSTTLKIYKYNGRATLSSVVSGATTDAFLYATGVVTVSANDTVTAAGNQVLRATISHGAGTGVSSLYISVSGSIMRVPETSVIPGTTSCVADAARFYPPGTTNTRVAGNFNHMMTYFADMDCFYLSGGNYTDYLMHYGSGATQCDRIIGLHIGSGTYIAAAADPALAIWPFTESSNLYSQYVE